MCDGGCGRSFCLEDDCQANFGLPPQLMDEIVEVGTLHFAECVQQGVATITAIFV